MDNLKQFIREVPDWPKPGILFYDITTLLKRPDGMRAVTDGLAAHYRDAGIDAVAGVEARGFIFAPALAYALGVGFIPVRKPKKLPCETEFCEYELEYGTDRVEIHRDAVERGQRILVCDDVLATGGTAGAVTRLIEKVGGSVAGACFVIELDFLNGREKLGAYPVHSLVHY